MSCFLKQDMVKLASAVMTTRQHFLFPKYAQSQINLQKTEKTDALCSQLNTIFFGSFLVYVKTVRSHVQMQKNLLKTAVMCKNINIF